MEETERAIGTNIPESPAGSEQKSMQPARKTRAVAAAKSRSIRAKTELELLNEIGGKLDRLTAVIAAQGKERDTQVAILASAGCDSVFVGTFVGMSPGAIRKLPAWRRAQQDGESSDDISEDSSK